MNPAYSIFTNLIKRHIISNGGRLKFLGTDIKKTILREFSREQQIINVLRLRSGILVSMFHSGLFCKEDLPKAFCFRRWLLLFPMVMEQ